MKPDPESLSHHAVTALVRGFEEFVRSFTAITEERQQDCQIQSIIGLNRGIELIAKYWLLTTDPALVIPARKLDDYLKARGLVPDDDFWSTTHTISGVESLQIIERLLPEIQVKNLIGLNSIRNTLEHFPFYDTQHLKQKLDSIPEHVVRELETFFTKVLKVEFGPVIGSHLLTAVKACSNAREEVRVYHSRLAQHRKLWEESGEELRQGTRPYPEKYHKECGQIDIRAKCPVCSNQLAALYVEQAEYDDETGAAVLVYGDVRCVYCEVCHYWTDEHFGITRFVRGGVLEASTLFPPP